MKGILCILFIGLICALILTIVFIIEIFNACSKKKKLQFIDNLTIDDFNWKFEKKLTSIKLNSVNGIMAHADSITKRLDGKKLITVNFNDAVYENIFSKYLPFTYNTNPFSFNKIERNILLDDWEKFKTSVEDIQYLQIEVYVFEANYQGSFEDNLMFKKYNIEPSFYVQEYDVPDILTDLISIREAQEDSVKLTELKNEMLDTWKNYIMKNINRHY